MTGDSPPARRFFSPCFVAVAILLLVSAVGLRPAIGGLVAYFSKEPIELRKKLDELDVDRLPSWRVATERLALEMAEGDVETDDVLELVFEPRVENPTPNDQAMLFVTYYSDPRDRISHTPEVCYRQGGAVIDSISTVTLTTPELGPEHPEVAARLLDIDLIARRTVLLYVFICNGKFFDDREKVRFEIGWPGDSHIYFSKVEVITPCATDDDFDAAVVRCRSLMREALPLLVAEHYPRNEDVR